MTYKIRVSLISQITYETKMHNLNCLFQHNDNVMFIFYLSWQAK